MKKWKIIGALSLSTLIGGGTVLAADFKSGANYVAVSSCRQVGSHISISRGGQSYMLTSGCRDAGHGMRDYTLRCTGAKKYLVTWKNCATRPALVRPALQPAPTPTPVGGHDDHDHEEHDEHEENHENHEKTCTSHAQCNDGVAHTVDWCHTGHCHNDTTQCTTTSQCSPASGVIDYTCGKPFGNSAPSFCTK